MEKAKDLLKVVTSEPSKVSHSTQLMVFVHFSTLMNKKGNSENNKKAGLDLSL